MAKADSRRGHQRERDLVRLLRDDDWFAMRAPASLGCADVIALRAGDRPRMIEVKSTTAGPYAGFPPADRARLKAEAEIAGAVPWLVWWPKRSRPVWIPESAWP